MTDDVNVRFPGSVTVRLELGEGVLEAIQTLQPAPQMLGQMMETEDTAVDDLDWLIDKGMHLMLGKGDEGPYVRVMPIGGIQGTMLKGPIDRSLRRLRREIGKQLK